MLRVGARLAGVAAGGASRHGAAAVAPPCCRALYVKVVGGPAEVRDTRRARRAAAIAAALDAAL